MKRLIIFIAIILSATFIALNVELYRGKTARNFINDHPFVDVSDIKAFFENNLLIGETTYEDVATFLEAYQIPYQTFDSVLMNGTTPATIIQIELIITNPGIYTGKSYLAQLLHIIWERFTIQPHFIFNYRFSRNILREIDSYLRVGYI